MKEILFIVILKVKTYYSQNIKEDRELIYAIKLQILDLQDLLVVWELKLIVEHKNIWPHKS